MTQEEIILETIEAYTDPKNRSMLPDSHACAYAGEGGKMCAYARMIKPEYRHLLVEQTGCRNQVKLMKTTKGDPYIEKYSGHPTAFYAFIQYIHDVYLNPAFSQKPEGIAERIKNRIGMFESSSDTKESLDEDLHTYTANLLIEAYEKRKKL